MGVLGMKLRRSRSDILAEYFGEVSEWFYESFYSSMVRSLLDGLMVGNGWGDEFSELGFWRWWDRDL